MREAKIKEDDEMVVIGVLLQSVGMEEGKWLRNDVTQGDLCI